MVMSEQQYEDQYSNIYLPIISSGAHYTSELQKEMDSLQAAVNRHNKEVLDSAVIREAVGAILTTVAGSFHQNHPQE